MNFFIPVATIMLLWIACSWSNKGGPNVFFKMSFFLVAFWGAAFTYQTFFMHH